MGWCPKVLHAHLLNIYFLHQLQAGTKVSEAPCDREKSHIKIAKLVKINFFFVVVGFVVSGQCFPV